MKNPKPLRGYGKFAYIIDHINRKTHEQRLATIVAAGILRKKADGGYELTEKYRRGDKAGI